MAIWHYLLLLVIWIAKRENIMKNKNNNTKKIAPLPEIFPKFLP